MSPQDFKFQINWKLNAGIRTFSGKQESKTI